MVVVCSGGRRCRLCWHGLISLVIPSLMVSLLEVAMMLSCRSIGRKLYLIVVSDQQR
jgi:hypothetical protein